MKTSRIILILLLGLVLFDCSDNSTKPKNEEPSDTISGIYFLHGYQVSMRFCYIGAPDNCRDGEVLSRDTTQIAFTVNVRVVEDRADTLQFFGLDGANAGYRSALPADCTDIPDLCAYAKFTDHQLKFDFIMPAGSYHGTGTLEGGEMTLDSHFGFRSIGIDYNLEGVRIDD